MEAPVEVGVELQAGAVHVQVVDRKPGGVGEHGTGVPASTGVVRGVELEGEAIERVNVATGVGAEVEPQYFLHTGDARARGAVGTQSDRRLGDVPNHLGTLDVVGHGAVVVAVSAVDARGHGSCVGPVELHGHAGCGDGLGGGDHVDCHDRAATCTARDVHVLVDEGSGASRGERRT